MAQASQLWSKYLDQTLRSFGLHSAKADPCLYILKCMEDILYIAIQVDDLLVVS